MTNQGIQSPFVLKAFIAGGAFGQVYRGVNERTNQPVAIKLEHNDNPHRQLYLEFGFYGRLGKRCPYIPAIHFFGVVGEVWNALVMDLLGPSLKKLFETMGNFSEQCTAAVGVSLMRNFADFHGKGLLFRDVKPDNFLVGRTNTENAHTIYLIGERGSSIVCAFTNLTFYLDLGLAKDWHDENGHHIPYVTGKPITGTPQFMSSNMHLFRELSRRDDIESLVYVLIYLQTGSLPWFVVDDEVGRNMKKRVTKYGDMKTSLSAEEVCAHMPAAYTSILKKVRKLKFAEAPDYKGYIHKLESVLAENSISRENLEKAFDWSRSHTRRSK